MPKKLPGLFALLLVAAIAGCTQPETKPDCRVLIAEADGTDPQHTRIQVETNFGAFYIELFDDASPVTSANFRKYVETGYYDRVVLHRIIEGFMAQGGKFDNTTKQPKTPTQPSIVNEAATSGCLNDKYTLSMARTQDPNSARTEFFINFVHNEFLDPTEQSAGYAVFGIVYDGRDVIDRIESVPVHVFDPAEDQMCQAESGNRPNCPDTAVEMKTLRVTTGRTTTSSSTSSPLGNPTLNPTTP